MKIIVRYEKGIPVEPKDKKIKVSAPKCKNKECPHCRPPKSLKEKF